MRFLFFCIFFCTTPALANNSVIRHDLQKMTASIRFAEQQSSKIDKALKTLETEKLDLETNLSKYSYETARQIHTYHVLERSPARLSFLHPDKSFLDHYHHLKSQESTKNILMLRLSDYNNQLITLNDKTEKIKNHIQEKEDLKIAIISLLNIIKTRTKQNDNNAITEELEALKSRHNNLNNFLSDLMNIKNLNYTASKSPEFSIPLSGIIKQQNNRLLIESSQNALVTAPAAGRVLYADIFKNLGKLVVIDHGYGYVSILRGFKDLVVEGGYILNDNDPIGIIGGDEWHKGKNSPILYYDLRYNNDSINPIDKITGL